MISSVHTLGLYVRTYIVYRGLNSYLQQGGKVVIRRAAALLFCQNMAWVGGARNSNKWPFNGTGFTSISAKKQSSNHLDVI